MVRRARTLIWKLSFPPYFTKYLLAAIRVSTTPHTKETAQESNRTRNDRQNTRSDRNVKRKEKSEHISVNMVRNPISGTMNRDAIKTLTTELHSIKSALQAWKKSRKQEVSGQRYVPAPFVIISHSYRVAQSDRHTPFVSYRNSPELNALLVKKKK